MTLADEHIPGRTGQVEMGRVEPPPLLNGRFTDVEGAAGIEERRRHPKHLQEDAETKQEDETNVPS